MDRLTIVLMLTALRVLAAWLKEKAAERAARFNSSEIMVQAYQVRE